MVKLKCCVRDCRSALPRDRSCGFSWFSVPYIDKIRREKWLKFIMNVEEITADLDEQKTKNWRMCSLHFEPKLIQRENSGKSQKARLRHGAVPTIRTTSSAKRMLPESRSAGESEPHTKTQRMDVEVKAVTSEALQVIPLQGSVSNETLSSLRNVVHDLRQARKDKVCEYSVTQQLMWMKQDNEKLKQEKEKLKQENEKHKQENEKRKQENEKLKEALLLQKEELCRKAKKLEEEMKSQILALELKSSATKSELQRHMDWCKQLQDELETSKFRFNNLKTDANSFLYFSGFTVERFETLFDFLGGEACEDFLKIQPRSGKPKVAKIPSNPNQFYYKTGPPRELAARDQLLMVLCRLRFRHGLMDLGSRFKVSQASVSRVCSSWIPELKKRFQEAGIWHEGKESKYHGTPENLKPLYQKIKLLIEGIKKEDNQVKTNNPKKSTEKKSQVC